MTSACEADRAASVATAKSASDVLEKFGGHAQAGGFTALLKHEQQFAEKIIQATDTMLKSSDSASRAGNQGDLELHIRDISLDVCDEMARLEPYGQGNDEPLFVVRNVALNTISFMGDNNQHFRCILDDGVHTHKALGFNLSEKISSDVQAGTVADVFFYLRKDEYRGVAEPLVKIVDVVYAK